MIFPLFSCLLFLQIALHSPRSADASPVEYEYYYEDDYEDEPAAPAAAVKEKPKDSNYDIEDLVKAWREYLKEKKNGGDAEEEEEEEEESGNTGNRNTGNRNTGNRNTGNRNSGRRNNGNRNSGNRNNGNRNNGNNRNEDDENNGNGNNGNGGNGNGRRKKKPVVIEEEYDCEPRSESYRTADPKQCDKYVECNIKGEEAVKLCPDGLVFDIYTQNCDYPAKVDCSARPELQPAQPTTNCSRANGFFPFPANESCQKFWDCRGGKAYLQICPEGVIFDPKIDACTTPDQSARPGECAAGKFLGFECPTYTEDDVLRFGNHDRLPDPNDCLQFFSCLRSGLPRLGKCPKKTVFNPATGQCSDPKGVPGCETFWSEKDKANGDDYKDGDY